ncbi:MAG: peptidoglycan DD-metalloendopeptidase family protein [Sulfurospirillum sp.]|nr:peptidoglycan DD-metalloendopeptidase family protein [Sulfurospirillum sp.]
MKISTFFALFFCTSLFVEASSLEKKINAKAQDLRVKSQSERTIAKKLEQVASEVLQEQKVLIQTDAAIESLSISIEKNKNLIKTKEENLQDLTTQNVSLIQTKKGLEEKITKIIAQDFAFYLVVGKEYQDNMQAILIEEVMAKMDVIMQKEFVKLSSQYKNINAKIDMQASQIESLKNSIEELHAEKIKNTQLKKSREEIIKNLNSKKESYKKELEKIEKERQTLRATLEKLKILQKEEELQKLQALEEAQRKQQSQQRDKLTVRQIGTSYQNSKVQSYNGKKTIAPLENFSVKRKFGDYIDPIYNIKIFNESVLLHTNEPDAKVRNVLDGKIIYAKDTAMLDKVVIVENSYGIHTIYAHLSKIAPTIQVGQKIKKGYILGRVDGDLTFEVTQKSYHIDPLQLIEIK